VSSDVRVLYTDSREWFSMFHGFTRASWGSVRSLPISHVLADVARDAALLGSSTIHAVRSMSVFGALKDKIFGHHAAATATPASSSAPSAAPSATAAAASSNVSVSEAATAPVSAVDVEEVLSTMAKDSGKKLDWRNSIVDLLTLTGIDSSMVNRRALATELGYTGDLNDSAPMNIWLHKQVMRKLAENGGIVPGDLTD
jgi:Domain of unknown function (DUF3597)